MPVWSGPDSLGAVSHVLESLSTSAKKILEQSQYPSLRGSAMVLCGPVGFSSREDGGTPYLHKSLSGSSGTCPYTHERVNDPNGVQQVPGSHNSHERYE